MFEGLFQVVITIAAFAFGIFVGYQMCKSKKKQKQEYQEFVENQTKEPELEIVEEEQIQGVPKPAPQHKLSEEVLTNKLQPKPAENPEVKEKSLEVDKDVVDTRSEKKA